MQRERAGQGVRRPAAPTVGAYGVVCGSRHPRELKLDASSPLAKLTPLAMLLPLARQTTLPSSRCWQCPLATDRQVIGMPRGVAPNVGGVRIRLCEARTGRVHPPDAEIHARLRAAGRPAGRRLSRAGRR
jgi:hypothetical protein